MTDATLCAIARCLLSSVDLLLISNLIDVLSVEFAENVMQVLKDMVKERQLSYLKTENAALSGFHKPKTVSTEQSERRAERAPRHATQRSERTRHGTARGRALPSPSFRNTNSFPKMPTVNSRILAAS